MLERGHRGAIGGRFANHLTYVSIRTKQTVFGVTPLHTHNTIFFSLLVSKQCYVIQRIRINIFSLVEIIGLHFYGKMIYMLRRSVVSTQDRNAGLQKFQTCLKMRWVSTIPIITLLDFMSKRGVRQHITFRTHDFIIRVVKMKTCDSLIGVSAPTAPGVITLTVNT